MFYNDVIRENTRGGHLMKTDLGDNIRKLRKERGLTQEQLAEVFGVTVGAVHKWEAGMSSPDITLIMDIADFFDLSVDVLLGFELRDNRMTELSGRLKQLRASQDEEAVREAEKALKKYPNSFEVVHESANIYSAFGMVGKVDKKLLSRAMELYDQAIKLLPQSTDHKVDESVIYGEIATIHMALGHIDKAIDLLKEYNSGGKYDNKIGYLLAMQNSKEGDIFLSYSILNEIDRKFHTVIGKAFLLIRNGAYEDAIDLLRWGIESDHIFRSVDKINFLDKLHCYYLVGISLAQLKLKDKDSARKTLISAVELAERFDKDPDYDGSNLRFVSIDASRKAIDATGQTAVECIDNLLLRIKDPELTKLKESISK